MSRLCGRESECDKLLPAEKKFMHRAAAVLRGLCLDVAVGRGGTGNAVRSSRRLSILSCAGLRQAGEAAAPLTEMWTATAGSRLFCGRRRNWNWGQGPRDAMKCRSREGRCVKDVLGCNMSVTWFRWPRLWQWLKRTNQLLRPDDSHLGVVNRGTHWLAQD